jgi:hypothetical protein
MQALEVYVYERCEPEWASYDDSDVDSQYGSSTKNGDGPSRVVMAANELLNAAAALPDPPALRLCLCTPLQLPPDFLTEAKPFLRHLSIERGWGSPWGAFQVWEPLTDVGQLSALTSLTWDGEQSDDKSNNEAQQEDCFAAAGAALLAMLDSAPQLRLLRALEPTSHGLAQLAPSLARLSALTQLDLWHHYVDDCRWQQDGGTFAAAVSQLRVHHVSSLQPLQPLAAALSNLPALADVTLSWQSQSHEHAHAHASWPVLAQLTALRHLEVEHRDDMPASGIASATEYTLQQAMPLLTRLTLLHLSNIDIVTAACARALAGCAQLKTLTLRSSVLSDAALGALAAGGESLMSLTDLEVVENECSRAKWSAAAVAALVSPLLGLRRIRLSQTEMQRCNDAFAIQGQYFDKFTRAQVMELCCRPRAAQGQA